MIWACHEEKTGVCRKKDDGNRDTGKEEKKKTEEKIFGCCEEGYGEVGAREKDIKNRTLWLPLIKRKIRKKKKKLEL